MNLEEEILKFRDEVLKNYKLNNSNLVYLRLSTLDDTIEGKDNQIKEALDKFRADFNELIIKYPNLKDEGLKLFVEVESAYKDNAQKELNRLYTYLFTNIRVIDVLRDTLQVHNKLYLVSWDRISRRFLKGLSFQLIRHLCKIPIYSLMPNEIQHEEKYKDIIDKENIEQTFFIFELMLNSSSASRHSEEMSKKIKRRVMKGEEGITISSKSGKKWGSPNQVSDKMRDRIKERFKRFTIQQINEQADIYKDLKEGREPIPINTLRKIVQGKE